MHVHVSYNCGGTRCALNTTFTMAMAQARPASEMSMADRIDDLITSSEINVSALRVLTTALADQVANSVMGPQHFELEELGNAARIRNAAFTDPAIMQGVVAQVTDPAQTIQVFENVVDFAHRSVQSYKREVERVIRREDLPAYENVQLLERQLLDHHLRGKNIELSWDAIKNGESVGRIHNEKCRSDLKSEMDQGIRKAISAYDKRSKLQDKLQRIVLSQEDAILNDTMTGEVARRENDVCRLLKEQILLCWRRRLASPTPLPGTPKLLFLRGYMMA